MIPIVIVVLSHGATTKLFKIMKLDAKQIIILIKGNISNLILRGGRGGGGGGGRRGIKFVLTYYVAYCAQHIIIY